ncbi:MAG: phosphoenolpyruvate carboxylase [Gemmatimonadetes bacterium]|nr:MAG: phosphoenolpyruvate carboxylase [Gemmatimonadota bacterium]
MTSTHGATAVPLPPPVARPQDGPLRQDVRWLAATLGRVVGRLAGEETFRAVEELRRACRARRLGVTGAPDLDALLARTRSLAPETARLTARAFTVFFILINAAEQAHRVRRSRQDDLTAAQRGSVRWSLRRLREAGRGAEEVARALASLDVRPVLTAHPTESARRTILDLQARLAEGLLTRDGAPEPQRRAIDRHLEGEVELLWLTEEIRRDRPSVMDEVSNALWYLEDRLLEAASRVRERLVEAFEDEFGRGLGAAPVTPLTLGSWVGGDRDGNPFVTAEITLAAARRARRAVLDHYAKALADLAARLSVSERLATVAPELRASLERDRDDLPAVWEQNRRRNADEPLRLKVSFMRARVGADPPGYGTPQELERDLTLLADALDTMGAAHARRALVEPLLAQVRAHGFHGFRLDLREDAAVHTRALHDLTAAVGLGELDGAALRRELAGRRPLHASHVTLAAPTDRALEVFRVMRAIQDEIGGAAASTYIVSRTRSADDLLRVLLLAREGGLVDLSREPALSRVDIVPLFETLEDLGHAPAVVRSLLDDPIWRRQLEARGRHQEVMLGYSDSAKDAGLLPSAWALYRVQEEVARACAEAGVSWTLFHGRGGTVGRGGGSPVARALTALPPGTVHGGIKITEQGEIVSQNFGLPSIAERSLELMLGGVLLHRFEDWRSELEPGEEARFREVMDRLAAQALPPYRALVYGSPDLFKLFLETTPVRELAHVRFGSRPAYRGGGSGEQTMEEIRAIPWVFGWTQTRLMLPGWLGVGTALEAVAAEPGGLAVLRRMATAWPFFDDLLGKLEMVCAKADMAIARMYVHELGGDLALFDRLDAEFQRTVAALLRIRESDYLMRDNPMLQTAIGLRNPYVDPLSLLQVTLLQRSHAAPPGASADDPAVAAVSAGLAATLNGIAQGLRNTG